MRDVDIGRAEVTSWVSDVRLYRHGAEDPVEMVAKAVKSDWAAARGSGRTCRPTPSLGSTPFALRRRSVLPAWKTLPRGSTVCGFPSPTRR